MAGDSSRARAWLVGLLLFAGTLALYARVRDYPFVAYDDDDYVHANPVVGAGMTVEGVRWAFTTAHAYNWHPLTWLSHMLDVQMFGLDAGAHHLVNVCLHAANAVLLLVALRAMTGALWRPALVAALFAVHPLRVESVAWVAERKDLLAGTFWMLTLLAYASYARAPSWGRYAAVAGSLTLGLLAKPTVVSLPLVLVLLDFWPLGRWPSSHPSPAPTHPGKALWRTRRTWAGDDPFVEKLPLLALCAASAVVTLVVQHGGGAVNMALPFGERLMNAFLSYAIYLRQAFWPAGLAVFYPHPALVAPEQSRLVPAVLAALLLAGASALALITRRRWPWIFVGWCWFIVALLPMIGLLQVGAQAHADRYTYLPMIGIYVALVWSVAECTSDRSRTIVAAACGCALLVLSGATWRVLGTWKSSTALFERSLLVTERNHVAHNNLGLALAEAGRLDEALQHFDDAARILPGFFEAQLNLGKARYRRGELESARSAFERAVQARPAHAEAHFDLAIVLHRLSQLEEADAELSRAFELDASYGEDPGYRAERESLDRHLRER